MGETILAALRASLGSPSALTLLALIELRLAEGPSARAQPELDELIHRWAAAVIGIDRREVEHLKDRLGRLGGPREFPSP